MKFCEKTIVTAAFGCLMFLMESCSSSTLFDEWSDPSFHEPPLKKILVIAIRMDLSKRRIWEDAFSGELSENGVQATSSYRLFPDVLPDTAQVLEAIQKNGFDGILVTRLLLPDTSSDYVESSVTTQIEPRYNLRRGYDTYYKQYVQNPGYFESQITKRHSIHVWLVRNEGRMIWSAISTTPETNTIEAMRNDIAGLVIPELARLDIIKSER
jgi:hypothetical protein